MTVCWRNGLVKAMTLMVLVATLPTASSQELSEMETAAQRGLRLLRTLPYGKADIQVAHFDELWRYWPDPKRQQAENATSAERRQMALEHYGMVADPEDPMLPPLGVVDDQQGGWVMNCLSCHQGTVDGKVVWGVGNNRFAFQTLINDVVKLMQNTKRPVNPLMKFMDLGKSNGTTNAQIFSVLLSSLRDRDLNRLALPRPVKYQNHDLDAPPLWNVRHKRNLYIDGYIPKTHRVIMQFTLTPANEGREIIEREDGFRDILTWIESLEAPAFPVPIDLSLAAEGEAAFNKVCADCHGTYGANRSFPELRIPIDEIQTDPIRLTGIPLEHRQFMRESWFGNYGELDIVEQPNGYVAPPLDGVWASAPYLHNGSVPTLWHLMNPSERPSVWRIRSSGYDWNRVGLDIETMDEIPQVIVNDERRTYFDTSLIGKSARGHDFPDELNANEKLAVIEYLKTL